MIEFNGAFYGVTSLGGNTTTCNAEEPGCGTVFSFDPATRTEKVLHAFGQDGTDGFEPTTSLTEANGLLYGTTTEGGATGKGTVYSIDPATGAEVVVYSFCSQQNCVDGEYPDASLFNVNGTLYGTTEYGGTGTCSQNSLLGCGTVFAITP